MVMFFQTLPPRHWLFQQIIKTPSTFTKTILHCLMLRTIEKTNYYSWNRWKNVISPHTRNSSWPENSQLEICDKGRTGHFIQWHNDLVPCRNRCKINWVFDANLVWVLWTFMKSQICHFRYFEIRSNHVANNALQFSRNPRDGTQSTLLQTQQ